MTPQLLVTLTPEGDLAVELPGAQATRRQIKLRLDSAGASLLRMLEAQSRQVPQFVGRSIGAPAEPTAAQLRHWEDHASWPDRHCQFCIAEGAVAPSAAGPRARRPARVIERRADGVEIRRVPECRSGLVPRPTKNPEDLGL